MAIDPSIPLNANRPTVQPYNALTGQMQAATTANALFAMRQRQMQFSGQQALSQAYQGVQIDPRTGLPDSQQLIANLQSTPGGGLVLPQVIQGLQQQQKLGFELNKASLDQTTARTNVVNNAFGALVRKGASVTPADIFSTVGGLQASGFPVGEAVNDMAATMPTRQSGMSDQQYGGQLQDWLLSHASRTWGADTQASQFKPSIGTVENGGQIYTRDTNAFTNPGITSAPPIVRQLSPSEQFGQVKGPVGPNGQPTVIPGATYAQQQGLGYLVPGTGGQPSAFANGGRLPQALMNPNRLAATPAAAGGGGGAPTGYAPPQAAPAQQIGGYVPVSTSPAPGAPQGGPPAPGYAQMPAPVPQGGPAAPMAVSLSPSQAAGQTAAGTASANQWAALQNSVGGSAGRIYQLQAGLQGLQQGGPTGPSSGTINNMKSYLLSLPVIGQNLGIDPNQVSNYDEANKYLTAYAAARAGAHGGTTDQQLATTLSSNASTHISNLAAQNVVKANIGLERMDQAQIASFQNGLDPVTGQPTGQRMTPDQFSDYAAKWNTAQDPRAFVADQLTPQQFATTVSGMQPAERARFQQTFNSAISNGFMDPPSWMQGQATGTPAGGVAPAPPQAPAPPTAAAPAPLTQNGYGQPAAVGGY